MEILKDALEYHALGWSIIPIQAGEKQPACKTWKKYQTERASDRTLKRWFGNGSDKGIAVVFGPVSGHLACRDFDKQGAYEKWAAAHRKLAEQLPTVRTGRGHHVYFTVDPLQIQRRTDSGCLTLGDGELRLRNCYCVLPPSKHPSGRRYKFLTPFPFLPPLPTVDVVSAGLWIPSGDVIETQEVNSEKLSNEEQQESKLADGVKCTATVKSKIEEAIGSTLPTGPGRRNKQVFELARALKAMPSYADVPVEGLRGTLEPAVREWHQRALPHISTEPFPETWIDFITAWPKVKWPKGGGPMTDCLTRAKAADCPAEARRYDDSPGLLLLYKLCRELQSLDPHKPFYLSCRTVADLLQTVPMSAWRWFYQLEVDGIIRCVERGKQGGGRATRWEYLGK